LAPIGDQNAALGAHLGATTRTGTFCSYFPAVEAATGLALALALTGSFRVTTTPLPTAKEMDAGAKRMPAYRAPGT